MRILLTVIASEAKQSRVLVSREGAKARRRAAALGAFAPLRDRSFFWIALSLRLAMAAD
jgi:hypothetical protein